MIGLFRTLVVNVLVLLTLLVLLVGQLVCWTESSIISFQFQGDFFSLFISFSSTFFRIGFGRYCFVLNNRLSSVLFLFLSL